MRIIPAVTLAGLYLIFTPHVSGQNSDGTVLPIPPAPFKGKIGKTFADSRQDYPQPVQSPAGAPNVVLILIDDLGFGHPSTFGSPIPTPALDRLAGPALSKIDSIRRSSAPQLGPCC